MEALRVGEQQPWRVGRGGAVIVGLAQRLVASTCNVEREVLGIEHIGKDANVAARQRLVAGEVKPFVDITSPTPPSRAASPSRPSVTALMSHAMTEAAPAGGRERLRGRCPRRGLGRCCP